MIKKAFKILLVVMMLFGVAIALSNILETDIHAGEGWVKYHKEIPDCFGVGSSCIDMTQGK